MQNSFVANYDISLDPYYYNGGYGYYPQSTQYYSCYQEPSYFHASMGPIAVPNEIPFPEDFLECHNPVEEQPHFNNIPVYDISQENATYETNVQPEFETQENPIKKQRYSIRKAATLPYALVVGLSLYNIKKAVPVITLYKFIKEHFPGIAVDEVDWQKSIRCHLCSSSYFQSLGKSNGEKKAKWTFKSHETMEEFLEALRNWMQNDSDVRHYGVKSGADWEDLLAGRKSVVEPESVAKNASPRTQYKVTESRYLQRLSRKRFGMPYLIPAEKPSTISCEPIKPANEHNADDNSNGLMFYSETNSPWFSQPNFFW